MIAEVSGLETLHAGAAVVEIVAGAKELLPVVIVVGAKALHLHVTRKQRDAAHEAEREHLNHNRRSTDKHPE